MNKNIKVGIVGAGIQGVSNALFLQKKGFNVTIFDRDNPGAQAASYGNAGHFSPYASVPLNRPDVLADVPSMLLSSSGPFGIKMELCPENDSLVFKIYHEFYNKKNDAHCKKYASNFRFSLTSI
jgi:D-amino-acid dehydrogenase